MEAWSTNIGVWGCPAPQSTSSSWNLPQARKHEVKIIDNPVTPEMAIDCEMVEATVDRRRFSVLARVSVVNSYCQPLLDTYVEPEYCVSDYRTPYSGIRPEHLDNAPTYYDVRECVIHLVNGRTLIGHDLKQDLSVLGIKNHPNIKMRDTSSCYMSYFKPNEKPSLKRLASAVLGLSIQSGAHDSLEDAKAAMQLYKNWILLGRSEEDAVPCFEQPKKSNRKYKNKNRNNNDESNTTSNQSNSVNQQQQNRSQKQQQQQNHHKHHKNYINQSNSSSSSSSTNNNSTFHN